MRVVVAVFGSAAILATGATASSDVTVAKRVFGHVEYTLSASDSRSGAYCVTVRHRSALDASSCGSLFAGAAHGISYLAHEGLPAPNYVAGPVVARATRVVVTYSDGTTTSIPTIAPPRGLARTIRFYVRFLPCLAAHPRSIVGVDAAGRTVATLRVPAMSHPVERC